MSDEQSGKIEKSRLTGRKLKQTPVTPPPACSCCHACHTTGGPYRSVHPTHQAPPEPGTQSQEVQIDILDHLIQALPAEVQDSDRLGLATRLGHNPTSLQRTWLSSTLPTASKPRGNNEGQQLDLFSDSSATTTFSDLPPFGMLQTSSRARPRGQSNAHRPASLNGVGEVSSRPAMEPGCSALSSQNVPDQQHARPWMEHDAPYTALPSSRWQTGRLFPLC